jgi:hypothetical protein
MGERDGGLICGPRRRALGEELLPVKSLLEARQEGLDIHKVRGGGEYSITLHKHEFGVAQREELETCHRAEPCSTWCCGACVAEVGVWAYVRVAARGAVERAA